MTSTTRWCESPHLLGVNHPGSDGGSGVWVSNLGGVGLLVSGSWQLESSTRSSTERKLATSSTSTRCPSAVPLLRARDPHTPLVREEPVKRAQSLPEDELQRGDSTADEEDQEACVHWPARSAPPTPMLVPTRTRVRILDDAGVRWRRGARSRITPRPRSHTPPPRTHRSASELRPRPSDLVRSPQVRRTSGSSQWRARDRRSGVRESPRRRQRSSP